MATGQTTYSWTYDPTRRCWVIWRDGRVYQVVPESRRNPANTESYVERCVAALNGDTHE